MSKVNMSQTETKQATAALEKLFASSYISRKHVYKENFIRGFFFSIGGIVGTTLGLALVLLILSLFSQVPFLGRFTKNVQQTIQINK